MAGDTEGPSPTQCSHTFLIRLVVLTYKHTELMFNSNFKYTIISIDKRAGI